MNTPNLDALLAWLGSPPLEDAVFGLRCKTPDCSAELSALKQRCEELSKQNAALRRRVRVLDVVQADLAAQHYGGDIQTLVNTAEAFAAEAREELRKR